MNATQGRYVSYNELRRLLVHRRVPKIGRMPPWSLTFADLMMLLLTFFVLLSSLSEIDREKYRMMAESAQKLPPASTPKMQPAPMPLPPARLTEQAYVLWAQEALQQELHDSNLEIEHRDGQMVLRIGERVAFPSASAEINANFFPTLVKIAKILEKAEGRIVVAGHSDDIPIHTFKFPSNWELSSARAAAVIQALMMNATLPKQRLLVEGYADSAPLVANDSLEHRARNRRVEIRVVTGAPRSVEQP
ncbi:MAG: OmpA family protein [Gammaproteobacteria bacterium]|nr:OmpA family protein [Gammaproteobacteria bacterium]